MSNDDDGDYVNQSFSDDEEVNDNVSNDDNEELYQSETESQTDNKENESNQLAINIFNKLKEYKLASDNNRHAKLKCFSDIITLYKSYANSVGSTYFNNNNYSDFIKKLATIIKKDIEGIKLLKSKENINKIKFLDYVFDISSESKALDAMNYLIDNMVWKLDDIDNFIFDSSPLIELIDDTTIENTIENDNDNDNDNFNITLDNEDYQENLINEKELVNYNQQQLTETAISTINNILGLTNEQIVKKKRIEIIIENIELDLSSQEYSILKNLVLSNSQLSSQSYSQLSYNNIALGLINEYFDNSELYFTASEYFYGLTNVTLQDFFTHIEGSDKKSYKKFNSSYIDDLVNVCSTIMKIGEVEYLNPTMRKDSFIVQKYPINYIIESLNYNPKLNVSGYNNKRYYKQEIYGNKYPFFPHYVLLDEIYKIEFIPGAELSRGSKLVGLYDKHLYQDNSIKHVITLDEEENEENDSVKSIITYNEDKLVVNISRDLIEKYNLYEVLFKDQEKIELEEKKYQEKQKYKREKEEEKEKRRIEFEKTKDTIGNLNKKDYIDTLHYNSVPYYKYGENFKVKDPKQITDSEIYAPGNIVQILSPPNIKSESSFESKNLELLLYSKSRLKQRGIMRKELQNILRKIRNIDLLDEEYQNILNIANQILNHIFNEENTYTDEQINIQEYIEKIKTILNIIRYDRYIDEESLYSIFDSLDKCKSLLNKQQVTSNFIRKPEKYGIIVSFNDTTKIITYIPILSTTDIRLRKYIKNNSLDLSNYNTLEISTEHTIPHFGLYSRPFKGFGEERSFRHTRIMPLVTPIEERVGPTKQFKNDKLIIEYKDYKAVLPTFENLISPTLDLTPYIEQWKHYLSHPELYGSKYAIPLSQLETNFYKKAIENASFNILQAITTTAPGHIFTLSKTLYSAKLYKNFIDSNMLYNNENINDLYSYVVDLRYFYEFEEPRSETKNISFKSSESDKILHVTSLQPGIVQNKLPVKLSFDEYGNPIFTRLSVTDTPEAYPIFYNDIGPTFKVLTEEQVKGSNIGVYFICKIDGKTYYIQIMDIKYSKKYKDIGYNEDVLLPVTEDISVSTYYHSMNVLRGWMLNNRIYSEFNDYLYALYKFKLGIIKNHLNGSILIPNNMMYKKLLSELKDIKNYLYSGIGLIMDKNEDIDQFPEDLSFTNNLFDVLLKSVTNFYKYNNTIKIPETYINNQEEFKSKYILQKTIMLYNIIPQSNIIEFSKLIDVIPFPDFLDNSVDVFKNFNVKKFIKIFDLYPEQDLREYVLEEYLPYFNINPNKNKYQMIIDELITNKKIYNYKYALLTVGNAINRFETKSVEYKKNLYIDIVSLLRWKFKITYSRYNTMEISNNKLIRVLFGIYLNLNNRFDIHLQKLLKTSRIFNINQTYLEYIIENKSIELLKDVAYNESSRKLIKQFAEQEQKQEQKQKQEQRQEFDLNKLLVKKLKRINELTDTTFDVNKRIYHLDSIPLEILLSDNGAYIINSDKQGYLIFENYYYYGFDLDDEPGTLLIFNKEEHVYLKYYLYFKNNMKVFNEDDLMFDESLLKYIQGLFIMKNNMYRSFDISYENFKAFMTRIQEINFNKYIIDRLDVIKFISDISSYFKRLTNVSPKLALCIKMNNQTFFNDDSEESSLITVTHDRYNEYPIPCMYIDGIPVFNKTSEKHVKNIFNHISKLTGKKIIDPCLYLDTSELNNINNTFSETTYYNNFSFETSEYYIELYFKHPTLLDYFILRLGVDKDRAKYYDIDRINVNKKIDTQLLLLYEPGSRIINIEKFRNIFIKQINNNVYELKNDVPTNYIDIAVSMYNNSVVNESRRKLKPLDIDIWDWELTDLYKEYTLNEQNELKLQPISGEYINKWNSYKVLCSKELANYARKYGTNSRIYFKKNDEIKYRLSVFREDLIKNLIKTMQNKESKIVILQKYKAIINDTTKIIEKFRKNYEKYKRIMSNPVRSNIKIFDSIKNKLDITTFDYNVTLELLQRLNIIKIPSNLHLLFNSDAIKNIFPVYYRINDTFNKYLRLKTGPYYYNSGVTYEYHIDLKQFIQYLSNKYFNSKLELVIYLATILNKQFNTIYTVTLYDILSYVGDSYMQNDLYTNYEFKNIIETKNYIEKTMDGPVNIIYETEQTQEKLHFITEENTIHLNNEVTSTHARRLALFYGVSINEIESSYLGYRPDNQPRVGYNDVMAVILGYPYVPNYLTETTYLGLDYKDKKNYTKMYKNDTTLEPIYISKIDKYVKYKYKKYTIKALKIANRYISQRWDEEDLINQCAINMLPIDFIKELSKNLGKFEEIKDIRFMQVIPPTEKINKILKHEVNNKMTYTILNDNEYNRLIKSGYPDNNILRMSSSQYRHVITIEEITDKLHGYTNIDKTEIQNTIDNVITESYNNRPVIINIDKIIDLMNIEIIKNKQ